MDELDIGMQKVQPLPYLGECGCVCESGPCSNGHGSTNAIDEEIKKFKEQIAQAAAEQGTDGGLKPCLLEDQLAAGLRYRCARETAF